MNTDTHLDIKLNVYILRHNDIIRELGYRPTFWDTEEFAKQNIFIQGIESFLNKHPEHAGDKATLIIRKMIGTNKCPIAVFNKWVLTRVWDSKTYFIESWDDAPDAPEKITFHDDMDYQVMTQLAIEWFEDRMVEYNRNLERFHLEGMEDDEEDDVEYTTEDLEYEL